MATTPYAAPVLTLPVNERDYSIGPNNAPLTLVEYGDYECPYCRMVYHNVQALQERLDDQMHYVFRHLPLTSAHPNAQRAAEAAEAAGEQGKFWEMHRALFENRELDEAHIRQYAEEIGLDMAQFDRDMAERRHQDKVEEDLRSGIESGANGTPTFFVNGERYDGAWDVDALLERVEEPLGVKVQLLGQRFTRIAALSGVLLMLTTIIALLWANSQWSESYFQVWATEFNIALGRFTFSEDLLHLVNDGLMVIFFIVVGLEIKREVLSGELADPKRAALPVAGAIGGMVVPALLYLLFNWGGPGASGWGIPVATDIAFTLGILTVLGKRVPLALKIFFTALAIADDLGAILVIAIFYSSGISWVALGIAGVILLILIGLNRGRVYASLPYALLGVALWLAFLESGVHPTLSGVLLAMTIPTRSPANMRGLLAQVTSLASNFALSESWRETIDSRRQATVQALETIVDRLQSPAQNLEHNLNPWSNYLILPIFALANAGIILSLETTRRLLDPISLGIILGLVVGKPVGITLVSWVAVRMGIAEKPRGVSWPLFFGVSCLAGIGFTMSIFITNSAFNDPALQEVAKLAIIVASVLAALLGTGLVLLFSPRQRRTIRGSE